MRRLARGATWAGVMVVVAACGGGNGTDTAPAAATAAATREARATATATETLTTPSARLGQEAAVRLANQATFGPTEALVNQLQRQGAAAWIQGQMGLSGSRYTSGGDDSIHTHGSDTSFCSQPAQAGNAYCWRDYYSSDPLLWDFYRNAVKQPDQLRQRVALALQHVLVVSANDIGGTYGLRVYFNGFLDLAFDNYRNVLRHVILSPVMGDYLDHVNNDPASPNENFARELLQLFSVGTCQLHNDGSMAGQRCRPVYDNTIVRNYAFALTGWTYPKGGRSYWGCWPEQAHCLYYGGPMSPVRSRHDDHKRSLLSGIEVPRNSSPGEALDLVIESLMQHDNLAPFVASRLIQHLVMGDPPPDYVGRVAQAFRRGQFTATETDGGLVFGTGRRGDLAATVAAILLDPVAQRRPNRSERDGHLRAPALLFTGAIRALNGRTDGAALGWYWGEALRHHVFRPPSVFSFYPPDYKVPGARRIGPEFGIHNSNSALNRLNFLTYLLDWGGSQPDPSVPGAVGTQVNLSAFEPDAPDAAALVDRLSRLLLGKELNDTPRASVIAAVEYWRAQNAPSDWTLRRVRTAAYLVMAAPDFQVQP